MELKEKLDVIKRARRLIDMGWCQGGYAEDKHGNNVDSRNKNACAWCSCGALRASMPDSIDDSWSWKDYQDVRKILDDYVENNGLGVALVDYNEELHRTQFDILHVFNEVIKQLEEKVNG